MNKTILLASVATCLLVANANAFELKQYVSGKLTYSDASHDVKRTDFVDRGEDMQRTKKEKFKFNDDVWGGSLAYGVKADSIRTELELNIKSKAQKTHDTDKFSAKNQSVMVNVYYDINTGTKFTPYVGAGIGMTHIKATSTYKRTGYDFSKSANTLTWQVGAGIAYAVTDNVSLDIGYRYTDAGNIKTKDVDSTQYYYGLTTDKYEAKYHEFLVGARYNF